VRGFAKTPPRRAAPYPSRDVVRIGHGASRMIGGRGHWRRGLRAPARCARPARASAAGAGPGIPEPAQAAVEGPRAPSRAIAAGTPFRTGTGRERKDAARTPPQDAAVRRRRGATAVCDACAPLFPQRFLEIGAQQVAASTAKPLDVKTWGDAVYGVFATPREGAEFALDLLARMLAVDRIAAGLPDTGQMRIALHAGPVFEAFAPIMARHGYFGANVTRAPRIEPITPPGMVYASEAFARVLVASGYALEYVDMLPLAKDYGATRIYRLERG